MSIGLMREKANGGVLRREGFWQGSGILMLGLVTNCVEPRHGQEDPIPADAPEVEITDERNPGIGVGVRPIVVRPSQITSPPKPPYSDTQVSSCVPTGAEVDSPLQLTWTQVPDLGLAEGINPNSLELRLKNTHGHPVWVDLRYEADAGGATKISAYIAGLSLSSGQEITQMIPTKPGLPAVKNMQTSGMIFAAAQVTNEETGEQEMGAVSPTLFWHRGGAKTVNNESSTITIYDELTQEQVFGGGDLLGSSSPSGASILPPGETSQGIPSRVISGPVAIVTPGSTTPYDLVEMGLLELAETPQEIDP